MCAFGSLARFKSSASCPAGAFFRGLRRGARFSFCSVFSAVLPEAALLSLSALSPCGFLRGFFDARGFSVPTASAALSSLCGFSLRRRRGRFGLSAEVLSKAPKPASAASCLSARLFSDRRLKNAWDSFPVHSNSYLSLSVFESICVFQIDMSICVSSLLD